jgi:dTDP-4-dehydrorhamnose 3,5-epimerase
VKAVETGIPGLLLLEPQVFSDQRGWFCETWNRRTLEGLGIRADFVQDNQSCSSRGTLRGLHYQCRQPQDKLLRVVSGAVFDVCVDLRRGSATYGRGFGVELSAANRRQLWVPKGFAHGFLVVSDTAEVIYKVTDYWLREAERGLRWDDPASGVAWPAVGLPPQLNARDAAWPRLADVPAGDLP